MIRCQRRHQLVAAIIAAVVLVPSAAWAGVFDDVPDGKFYSEAVEWAYANGITTGTSATTFEPDAPVTRGQNVTFTKRYHDNIVAPALAGIDAELDAAIAGSAADLAALESAVAALEAASPSQGDVVMVHSTADMEPVVISPPAALNHFINGTSVSDGMAVKALTGPASIGSVAYELHSLEYCIPTPTGDGFVDAIWIWGPSGQLVLDETDRVAAGCWSYDVDTAADGAFSFMVDASKIANGAIRVSSITTTWRPA